MYMCVYIYVYIYIYIYIYTYIHICWLQPRSAEVVRTVPVAASTLEFQVDPQEARRVSVFSMFLKFNVKITQKKQQM